jgi:DNA-binding NtrC family response regulator
MLRLFCLEFPFHNQSCNSCITVQIKRNFIFLRSFPMKRRILLVDDELAILLTLKAILEMNGFEVETAASAKEAAGKLRAREFHMVITDMRMETETAGYDVIRAARKQRYNPATAILTAFPALGSDWKNAGAHSLLVKPVGTDDLLRQIESLLIQHEDAKGKSARVPAKAAVAAQQKSRKETFVRKAG